MMLLPKTVGPVTLTQKISVGAIAESFEGTLSGPEQQAVRVRRILPSVLQDRARLTSVEARVRDLVGLKHPFLLSVLDWVEADNERLVIEETTDRIRLETLIQHARKQPALARKCLPEHRGTNLQWTGGTSRSARPRHGC